MKQLSTILVSLALSACAGAATSVHGSDAHPRTTEPPPALSPASPTPPSPPASKAGPQSPSPFTILGELPGELTLHPVGDRAFLLSQKGIELALVGDEVLHDPLLKRGLPADALQFSVDSVAGRWPDSAWISSSHQWGRSGFSSLWRWDGKQWSKNQSTPVGSFILGIQPWSSGRMLAVEQAGMAFKANFRILSGGARVALPVFSKAAVVEGFCVTQMRVDVFTLLPSGHAFAAGQRCDDGGSILDPAVERWEPGAQRGTLELLPGTRLDSDPPQAGWSVVAIAALSPTDVFVAALKEVWSAELKEHLTTEYFAHFDGTSWQALSIPVPGGIRTLSAERDGVLFATTSAGELWSRAVSGAWSKVPLPKELSKANAGVKVRAFWSRGPGDAWAIVRVTAAGQTGERDFLLHTRPAVNPLPTLEAWEHKEREFRLPGPPVDGCETPFVLLYTLSKKAPAAYDYPATRAALKGHRELNGKADFIEFGRDGRRFFGAKVPDFKVAKQLADLVRDKVPGSTPELVCHDPLESRKLEIDLETGAMKN